jgi:hypothetical protein
VGQQAVNGRMEVSHHAESVKKKFRDRAKSDRLAGKFAMSLAVEQRAEELSPD